MEYDLVLFWLLAVSCVAGLIATVKRQRWSAPGWLAVYLAVLAMSVAGWLGGWPALVYAAAVAWFVLILLPMGLVRRCNRHLLQQRYTAAGRLVRIVGWFHPADGWRELPAMVQALELAQRGDVAAAADTLARFEDVKSAIGRSAMLYLYRITHQWEEFLAWYSRRREEIERQPEFLSMVLRAMGETGDVRGMVEFYHRHRQKIARLVPRENRDIGRLMLFAFCGKRQAVERLCAGSLAVLPPPIQAFWLATADQQAGATESAKRQLEALLPDADGMLRGAIERRLARISCAAQPLDASAQQVVEEAAREHGQEERFAVPRSLFSRRARATQLLILLNVLLFAVENCLPDESRLETLYRLGGLSPSAVCEGQWWRMIASTFLHVNALHLAMNMLGLWFLGPFVEFALGFRRFVLLYLAAGIGSMAMVFAISLATGDERLTVGASGCVMGLVGATGALMLRGWVREKALAARRQLVLVLLIVLTEVLVDSMIPQVSMTAHLSGALIGSSVAMFLRDQLRGPASQPPAVPSQAPLRSDA